MNHNHRLVLRRSWIGMGTRVNFIMLNPSTADETFDDPTVRKCIGFAKRWGFGSLVVTNLFAFRATDPKDLIGLVHRDRMTAIGECNNEVIRQWALAADMVVCAWGEHARATGRDVEVMKLLLDMDLMCIGRTKKRAPLHPVRAPYTSAPVPYAVKVVAA